MKNQAEGSCIIRCATSCDDVVAAAHLFDNGLQWRRLEDYVGSPKYVLLGAYQEDGTAVGFLAGVEVHHCDAPPEMYICEFKIAPAFTWLGPQMLVAMQEQAAKRACRRLWTVAARDDQLAMEAYKTAGARLQPQAALLSWDDIFAGAVEHYQLNYDWPGRTSAPEKAITLLGTVTGETAIAAVQAWFNSLAHQEDESANLIRYEGGAWFEITQSDDDNFVLAIRSSGEDACESVAWYADIVTDLVMTAAAADLGNVTLKWQEVPVAASS